MKVAVVGVGRWGENHVRVLSKLGWLYGVYDTNKERALDISKKYGTFAYQSLDDLSPSSLDAAVVATPASTHFSLGMQLVEKGINLLLEKPPTLKLKEALKIKEVSNLKGVKVGVGYIERFNPAFKELESCLKRSDQAYFFRLSKGSNVKDVGVIYDLMIHDINLSNHLFGNPKVVYKKIKVGDGLDVRAEAVIEYKTATSHLTASWTSPVKFRKIFAHSDQLFAEADLAAKTGFCEDRGQKISVEEKDVDLLEAEHMGFKKFIEEGSEFPNIEESLKDLEVIELLMG